MTHKRRKRLTLVPKDKVYNPERDWVMTPPSLALSIINHYQPYGKVLDPCRGEGAFYNQFAVYPSVNSTDWCEITEGHDFLIREFTTDTESVHYDWIVSNPPWSQIRPFTLKAMEVADNIVWLCLVNAFWMKARLRDMDERGFAVKEILLLDTPPHPWPGTGFQLGATHIQKGYKGDVRISRLAREPVVEFPPSPELF